MITERGLVAVIRDPTLPDLTYGQLAVLLVLSHHDKLLLRDVAEAAGLVHRSTATLACDRLEMYGFIRRWWSNERYHDRWVALTMPGGKYLNALAGHARRVA